MAALNNAGKWLGLLTEAGDAAERMGYDGD